MAQVITRAMQIIQDIASGTDYKVDKNGLYVWSNKRNRMLTVDRYAGRPYKVVKISDWPILMHRLVAYIYCEDGWKLVQPNCDVRFRDGDFDNLCWENLEVVHHETVGVSFNGRKWVAFFNQQYVGTFDEKDEAMLMYDLTAQQNGRPWEMTNKLLPGW